MARREGGWLECIGAQRRHCNPNSDTIQKTGGLPRVAASHYDSTISLSGAEMAFQIYCEPMIPTMKHKQIKTTMFACLCAGLSLCAINRLFAANPALPLLNEPIDVSGDFRDFSDLYYLADKLADFDPATGSGKITYQRAQYFTRQAFDNMLAVIKPVGLNEFPEDQYAVNPTLPFSIEFVSPRTVRIRMTSGPQVPQKFRGADAGRCGAAGSFLEIQQG